ncbi:MAG TPA: hypothetical protein ENJ11_10550 [Gammaproteobacteria bacterium]|nr:hypothetical protein [Gammaproteobacteria bacterium]
MDITIKNIRTLTLGSCLVALTACSSSPAPWTQEDPWSSKRAAEEESLPPDEAVADTSLNDPVLLADETVVAEPEPIYMQEPEAEPAPEVIVEVVAEEQTPEQTILSLPGSNYAVQVYASKTLSSIEKYKADNELNEYMIVKTDRNGETVYVLVDVYPDRATARAAAADIEAKTGSKPWVRSVAGLQKIVAQ